MSAYFLKHHLKVDTPNDFVSAVSELKKNTVARVAIVREGQHAILGLRIQ